MIRADLADAEFKRLRRLLTEFKSRVERGAMRKAVRAGGAVNLRNLRANVPRNNGHLKRTIKQKIKTYRRTGAVVSIVGQNEDFRANNKRDPKHKGGLSGRKQAVPLRILEWGTRPKKIVATKAKALALLMSRLGGGAVFVRSVQHPGVRAQRIVSRTEMAGRREIQHAVNRKLEEEIDREFMKNGGSFQ